MKIGFRRKSDKGYLCFHPRTGEFMWTIYRHPGFRPFLLDTAGLEEELKRLKHFSRNKAIIDAMLIETKVAESAGSIRIVKAPSIVLRSPAH